MTNVIGLNQTSEDRRINWEVMRSLKEDLRITKDTLPKEEDKNKINLRLNEANLMYNYFLTSYVKPLPLREAA